MFFFSDICSSKNPEKKKTCFILVFTKLLRSTTVFNIDNNMKCFLSSKTSIRPISEGSCDTEDWSNPSLEEIAIFHKLLFYCIFTVYSLCEHTRLLSFKKKSYWPQTVVVYIHIMWINVYTLYKCVYSEKKTQHLKYL